MPTRNFLFLQGPISPFFTRIARALSARGHAVIGINLCIGDQLFWRYPERINYRGSLQEWPAYIKEFLAQRKITDMVLLGEQRAYHRHAIAAAKELGIKVTVTDFGYLRPDWITLEREGMSGLSRFPRDPEEILSLAEGAPKADLGKRYQDSFWTMALWDIAYHLANFFLWWLYPNYRTHQRDNPILVYLGTGWRLLRGSFGRKGNSKRFQGLKESGKPLYVFPLQMENDFQIRAYSPFDDLSGPINMVIESFARDAAENAQLLVKIHPWDPGLKNWGKIVSRIADRNGIADRVHYFNGGDLDQMIRASRGMVTINSTAGIRALQLNSPLIVLGQALYDVPKLTFQGALEGFWSDAGTPDSRLLEAFINAVAASIQIRGVFYNRPGLDNAVAAAVERLHNDTVNSILPGTQFNRQKVTDKT